jgi:ATP-dependent Lhr-like helicase
MSKSQAEQAVDAWFAGRGWKVFPVPARRVEGGAGRAVRAAAREYRRRQDLRRVVRGAAARRQPFAARQASGLRVLWLTPMRALAADTQRSLEVSAQELGALARTRSACGTSARAPATPDRPSARARRRKLPGALITTPESLSLLLSHAGARDQFKHLDMIIIDEWHELMGSKRGVQVQLALARLRRWNPGLVVWGCRPRWATWTRRATCCWAAKAWQAACWSRAA